MKLKELIEKYFNDPYREKFGFISLSEVLYERAMIEWDILIPNHFMTTVTIDYKGEERAVDIYKKEFNSPDFEEFLLDYLKII